jgi:transposase-like protein
MKTAPYMLTYEQYQRKIANLKTAGDVTNFAKELIAPVLQTILEEEMTEHLGYPKYGLKEKPGGNSRNGHSEKTLRTSFGETPLAIPRDRDGEFTPQIVPKHATIQSDVEEKIIAMYGKVSTPFTLDNNFGFQNSLSQGGKPPVWC